MRAINYYVIVDKIKEAPKTVGGIELTEKQDNDVRYIKGTVISYGNLVDTLKEGDVVRYDKHAGFGVEHKGGLYYVLKISDIVLIE
jgi:co-chaperonin GroES (HSP10)